MSEAQLEDLGGGRLRLSGELSFRTVPELLRQGRVQVNLIVTGLGATTFEDVFTSFARDERESPPAIQRRAVQEKPSGEEDESTQRFEAGRDPLDVPAFMRRRAYANTQLGS